jgi:NhaP-type Na+/H+ or K+/H+ antiporter
MAEDAIAAIGMFGVATLAWAAFGGRLTRLNVTGPIFFTGVGLMIGPEALGVADIPPASETALIVAELTLALLLFSDAARLGGRAMIHGSTSALRVLAIGLPLVILGGWGLGLLVLDELLLWEAAILAAILAPTDAALGKTVVESRLVPRRVRNTLNIESGLNDGLSVPFFTLFLALAIDEGDAGSAGEWIRFALEEIGFGALVGIAVGVVGAGLLERTRARDWVSPAGLALAPVALALAAWAGADPIGGNGFIAAFVAGLVVNARTDTLDDQNLEFADSEGRLAVSAIFFLFGLSVLGAAIGNFTWEIALYALLSLTLVRMVPVALALVRSGFGPATLGFIGWFGPRGLASIVLSLTLLGEGAEVEGADLILTVTAIVVGASILAHGVSSRPLSRRYGASREAASLAEQDEGAPSVPTRYRASPGD